MKSIFKVTYFIHFVSDDRSLADYFEEFWIWRKPVFNDWSYKQRINHQNKNNVKSVVVNCGIL